MLAINTLDDTKLNKKLQTPNPIAFHAFFAFSIEFNVSLFLFLYCRSEVVDTVRRLLVYKISNSREVWVVRGFWSVYWSSLTSCWRYLDLRWWDTGFICLLCIEIHWIMWDLRMVNWYNLVDRCWWLYPCLLAISSITCRLPGMVHLRFSNHLCILIFMNKITLHS